MNYPNDTGRSGKKVTLVDIPDFFMTSGHTCNYLPGKEARTVFADPDFEINQNHYSLLARHGFRRSGNSLYRPQCKFCHACVPVRIDIRNFTMRKKHRRIWNRNRDITMQTLPADFNREYFELYRDYINTRHANGGMENPEPADFMQFLTSDWSETYFMEMRSESRLVAVAVMDRLDDGLSAVYSFFSPDEQKRSPGIYAILCEIQAATSQDLDWLYLGYWIRDCSKMQYKNEFNAIQYYYTEKWHHHPPAEMT